jgi:hypothetical protein
MSRDVVPPDPSDRALNLLDEQLGRYQGIIGRLAGNSVQVKTWCFTATAALGALAVERERPALFGIALLLAGTFFYLDAYYLTLEQRFRFASNELAERVAAGDHVELGQLVTIAVPKGSVTWWSILKCGASSHTAIVYLVLGAALAVGLLTTMI